MARPKKWRRVCCLPNNKHFGPLNSSSEMVSTINMTVVEYEAIRLIDLEGLTQEECASQMGVSRTTVQGIYIEARKKIAKTLVNGNRLFIEGGDYKLYDEEHLKSKKRGRSRKKHKNCFVKTSEIVGVLGKNKEEKACKCKHEE